MAEPFIPRNKHRSGASGKNFGLGWSPAEPAPRLLLNLSSNV